MNNDQGTGERPNASDRQFNAGDQRQGFLRRMESRVRGFLVTPPSVDTPRPPTQENSPTPDIPPQPPFPPDHRFAQLNDFVNFNSDGRTLILEMLKGYASISIDVFRKGNEAQRDKIIDMQGDLLAKIVDPSFTEEQRESDIKAADYRRKFLKMVRGLTSHNVVLALTTGFRNIGVITVDTWPKEINAPNQLYMPNLKNIDQTKL